ncbi:hypothetical protein CAPTEDRAFT_188662 [Capitella teleta]|uniref:Uncharacterized protein n=1 Tax=Capitella teleta TaxID=283909 RepID=R7UZ53_CAPTE|nr:hypothetical protein CAPTEDRAFT_188662 [Capitella teleta]|eukprot:ELU11853.1 hypothetical protein CAPTEDRAFT_188662 [Capitella teleta]
MATQESTSIARALHREPEHLSQRILRRRMRELPNRVGADITEAEIAPRKNTKFERQLHDIESDEEGLPSMIELLRSLRDTAQGLKAPPPPPPVRSKTGLSMRAINTAYSSDQLGLFEPICYPKKLEPLYEVSVIKRRRKGKACSSD